MLQYAVNASLIQFALPLNFAIGKNHKTITEPRPCFMIGMIQGVAAFTNSLLHIDPSS